MAVKNKVSHAIENFIDKGAAVKVNKDKKFKNILIRVPADLLRDIDVAIEKKPWYTKTQWVVEAIYEKLQQEE